MTEEMHFRFQLPRMPEGEALTGEEIEERLLDKLEAAGDDSLREIWDLICFYTRASAKEEKVEAYIRRFLDLADDPEHKGAAMLPPGLHCIFKRNKYLLLPHRPSWFRAGVDNRCQCYVLCNVLCAES